MENPQIRMEPKLGFFEVIKEVLTIPYKNPHFIIFTFLTSLPLFFSMLMYETFLQETLIQSAQILSQNPPFACHYCFDWTPLGFIERLIQQISHEILLLVIFNLGILHFLDFINTIAAVDSASIIYSGEDKNFSFNLKDMMKRLITETRFKGPLITSLYALFLVTLIIFGLFSLATHIYILQEYVFFVVLFGMIFIALFAKYVELSAVWDMGIVTSILEEKQGDVALVVSSYLTRGRRQFGVLFVLIFSLWRLALRMSCLYFGWTDDGGSKILVIAVSSGLMCLGNLLKWVIFVVYFYDCKNRRREKNMEIEV